MPERASMRKPALLLAILVIPFLAANAQFDRFSAGLVGGANRSTLTSPEEQKFVNSKNPSYNYEIGALLRYQLDAMFAFRIDVMYEKRGAELRWVRKLSDDPNEKLTVVKEQHTFYNLTFPVLAEMVISDRFPIYFTAGGYHSILLANESVYGENLSPPNVSDFSNSEWGVLGGLTTNLSLAPNWLLNINLRYKRSLSEIWDKPDRGYQFQSIELQSGILYRF